MGGCLALFILFIFWLLGAALISGGSESITGSSMIISALILIGFGGLIAISQTFKERKKEEKAAKIKEEIDKTLQDEHFSADESYFTNNNLAFIAVNEIERKLFIGGVETKGEINYKILKANEIMGVEVTENGKGILSSSVNKNTLGMAAVGGLLFGGAGAIVGAISGSNAKSRITEVSLKIALDNIKTPYIAINFVSDVVGKGTAEHNQILTTVEKWYGIINILIDREKRHALTENEIHIAST